MVGALWLTLEASRCGSAAAEGRLGRIVTMAIGLSALQTMLEKAQGRLVRLAFILRLAPSPPCSYGLTGSS